MKIASLIPSGTNIACALGLAENLVAISHCCDHPATTHLPIVTRSVVDSSLPPAQIDADVSAALQNGESLYQTDRELLARLKPDLVLTQTICDVCAVNAQTARRDLPLGAQLLNLSAISLEGLWADIAAVAHAAQVDASPLLNSLQARVETVQKAVENRAKKPRVLVLEWSEPPFGGGHWIPELVEIAGATHVLSGPGEPSRRLDWNEIVGAGPEVVVLAPCGYDLAQTVEQGRELLQNSPLGQMKIPVWATDATALFSRCTPASVRGLEVLAGILGAPFEFSEREAVALK